MFLTAENGGRDPIRNGLKLYIAQTNGTLSLWRKNSNAPPVRFGRGWSNIILSPPPEQARGYDTYLDKYAESYAALPPKPPNNLPLIYRVLAS